MTKRRKRIRAHANPLAEGTKVDHTDPDAMDWPSHFPAFFAEAGAGAAAAAVEAGEGKVAARPEVTIADIGCGFGGLLTTLSPLFPNELILGIEIRDTVVKLVEKSIASLRDKHAGDVASLARGVPTPYNNISVLKSNAMKYAGNYFRKGQLRKMFVLFADPHFKRSKFRLRIINPFYLDYFAFLLGEGGILYTITDVSDLHLWQKRHLDEHPLFERIPDAELADDPCFAAIHTGTQEGQKVSRNHGDKWPACYRRVASPASRTSAPAAASSGAAAAAAMSDGAAAGQRKTRVNLFDDD